jgi:hypothetical protein
VLLVMVAIIVALTLTKGKHLHLPSFRGSGCMVRSGTTTIPLNPDQAANAATIAGVARHWSMPTRAVTVAYAAAIQESDLENLPYGDRDSVGIFQQRPSQGWGTRRQLLDPVYASSRFFQALARVPGYRHLPVYQAAQAVQHSADGSAYSQFAGAGAAMAAGFTGQLPRSVWCWYGHGVGRHARLAAAGRELTRAFGPLAVRHLGDPAVQVRVRDTSAGWAVASWLVANAGTFGITTVSYDGYQWQAARGQLGWASIPRDADWRQDRSSANHHTAHGPVARRQVTFG